MFSSGPSGGVRGGAMWQTGGYDSHLNLLFWGTGNPNPDYHGGDRRQGDNLYPASITALDARTTGELLVAKPFINTTCAREIGEGGKPAVVIQGVATLDHPNRPACVLVPSERTITAFAISEGTK